MTHKLSVVEAHIIAITYYIKAKFYSKNLKQTKITMARNQLQSSLVVVCFAVFSASVYGELCRKFEKPENDVCDRKFCPLERIVDGAPNKCTSSK